MKEETAKHYTEKKWSDNLGPWMIWPPIILVVCIIALWFIVKVLKPLPAPLSDDTITIALAFIGIIATFIVVGNFSQVSAIREETKSHLLEHKNTIEEFQKNIEKLIAEENEKRKQERTEDKKTITIAYTNAITNAIKECINENIVSLQKEINKNKEKINQDKIVLQGLIGETNGIWLKVILSLIENDVCLKRSELWDLLKSMNNIEQTIKIKYKYRKHKVSARWSLGDDKKDIVFNEIKGSEFKLLEKNKIEAINDINVSIEDINLLSRYIVLVQQTQQELLGLLDTDKIISFSRGDTSATEF